MDKTILHRNPHLIIEPIDGEFFAVLNPLKKNALKVINAVQHRILMSADSGASASEIARGNGLSESQLETVLAPFLETGILSASESFETGGRRKSPVSLNLWIQTTDACNLRCAYCYIKTKDERLPMDDAVMDSLGRKILETVSERKLKKVSLRISGGEPFLVFARWRDFLKKLESRLSGKSCGLRVAFLTNGTLMDRETADIIKREKYRIAISMDGLRKFHDRARRYPGGKGSYRQVIRTIGLLRKCGVPFSIMTVVSNENLSHLADFTKFLVRRRIRFRYSIVDGVDIDYARLSLAFRECLDYMEKHIGKGYPFSKLFKLCDLKFGGAGLRTCSSGFSGGAVYVDGSVYFCQKQFGCGRSLGDIFEDDDLIGIVRRGERLNDLPQACADCRFSRICTGGCPLERKNGRGAECEFYREFIPRIIRLMGKERLAAVRKRTLPWPFRG